MPVIGEARACGSPASVKRVRRDRDQFHFPLSSFIIIHLKSQEARRTPRNDGDYLRSPSLLPVRQTLRLRRFDCPTWLITVRQHIPLTPGVQTFLDMVQKDGQKARTAREERRIVKEVEDLQHVPVSGHSKFEIEVQDWNERSSRSKALNKEKHTEEEQEEGNRSSEADTPSLRTEATASTSDEDTSSEAKDPDSPNDSACNTSQAGTTSSNGVRTSKAQNSASEEENDDSRNAKSSSLSERSLGWRLYNAVARAWGISWAMLIHHEHLLTISHRHD